MKIFLELKKRNECIENKTCYGKFEIREGNSSESLRNRLEYATY